MKDANKGLIDRARDAVMGVINTIRKLKNMLLTVLSKVARRDRDHYHRADQVVLIKEGPAGLWEWIMEKLSHLKRDGHGQDQGVHPDERTTGRVFNDS